jgi:hypothetical protein
MNRHSSKAPHTNMTTLVDQSVVEEMDEIVAAEETRVVYAETPYDDAQLAAIEKSLEPIGLNLDVSPFGLPLLDELKLAWWFAKERPPLATPKQRVAKLTAEIKKLEAALEVLRPILYSPKVFAPFVPDRRRAARALLEELSRVQETAHTALQRLVVSRRQLRDTLATRGGRSSASAKKRHVQFWRELTNLWQKLPATGRRRHKDLLTFLFVCSKPIFPAQTTDAALTAFIERLPKGSALARLCVIRANPLC